MKYPRLCRGIFIYAKAPSTHGSAVFPGGAMIIFAPLLHKLERTGGNKMYKHADLLAVQGNTSATEAFLSEYQQCVLLELEKKGVLRQEQASKCIERLKIKPH